MQDDPAVTIRSARDRDTANQRQTYNRLGNVVGMTFLQITPKHDGRGNTYFELTFNDGTSDTICAVAAPPPSVR